MSLRIISGERRGAKLKAPEGLETRPLRDRVREALFSRIRPRLRGAFVLDAFAGSGAVGLEAVSNGAAGAVFIEPAEAALAALRHNVGKLRFGDRATILPGRSPGALAGLPPAHPPFDILFLMPPYHSGLWRDVLASPLLEGRITSSCLAVCEIHRDEAADAPGGWEPANDRLYGVTRLLLLERKSAGEGAD